jgi:hypothetical protein
MNLDGFPWPIMGERKTAPIWDDDHFIIGSERFEILNYSVDAVASSLQCTAEVPGMALRDRSTVWKANGA